jgi:hypothetical protein
MVNDTVPSRLWRLIRYLAQKWNVFYVHEREQAAALSTILSKKISNQVLLTYKGNVS